MLYLRYLLLIFIVSTTSYIFSQNIEYESEINIKQPECLQYLGMGRGPRGGYRISFYNSCPDRVSAQVCVQERPGFFRLHQSAAAIPAYGHFDIFTYEGVAPSSVKWVSGDGGVVRLICGPKGT